MNKDENTLIAQQLLAKMGERADPNEIATLFSADVQFDVPGDVGALPWIGQKKGRGAVSDFIRGTRHLVEHVSFEVHGVLADEVQAVVLGRFASMVNATGKIIDSAFALVLTISGGQIIRFQMLEDSFAVSQAARL